MSSNGTYENGMTQRDFYQLISGDDRKVLTDQQSYLKAKGQAEPCRYPSLGRLETYTFQFIQRANRFWKEEKLGP